ncbi:MAG TPA: hypothetical protein VGB11_05400 [Candidatus Bathyarchaeia archaeon]
MLWKQLPKAMALYKGVTNNDEKYLKTIDNPTPENIVWFLNRWGIMRMHFDVDKISRCITESKNDLDVFRKCRFEIVDLLPLKASIQDIFQKFQESAGSPVAASKVLHVLVPHFFVMWDNAIRAGYGCGIKYDKAIMRNETYYVFLVRTQKELQEAIQSYADSHSIKNFVDASNALIRELHPDGRKTLAKIIDEYNFMKFTRGMEKGAELWTAL